MAVAMFFLIPLIGVCVIGGQPAALHVCCAWRDCWTGRRDCSLGLGCEWSCMAHRRYDRFPTSQ